MATLTFYRQVREDGGVRTGIEINGTTVLERFESGGDDHDPALVWYVDIRCEGANLPQTAEEARPEKVSGTFFGQSGVSTAHTWYQAEKGS